MTSRLGTGKTITFFYSMGVSETIERALSDLFSFIGFHQNLIFESCTVAIFSLIETCTEVVTSVFRQYETGLREGVIDVKVVLFFIFNYHNLRELFLK